MNANACQNASCVGNQCSASQYKVIPTLMTFQFNTTTEPTFYNVSVPTEFDGNTALKVSFPLFTLNNNCSEVLVLITPMSASSLSNYVQVSAAFSIELLSNGSTSCGNINK